MIRGKMGLSRPLWILLIGVFVNRFGSFVSFFLALYLVSKGYSATEAGLTVGAYGVGAVGATSLGGILTDKIGRRKTVILSMFSSAVSVLLLSQASILPVIVILSIAAGAASELYRPATNVLIADLVPPEKHVTTFALYRLAINLGVAIGPAIAGFLAARFFLLIFIGDALTSMVFGFLMLFALPPEKTGPKEQPAAVDDFWRYFRTDRSFLFFLLASIATAFIYFQFLSSLSLQVKAFGFSSVIYGLLISINGTLIVFLELPVSGITKKLPMQPIIACGMLLVGLGFGLTAFASNIYLLFLTAVIWTVGEMVHAPVSYAYVAALAPERLRGRYNGIWSLMWGIGQVLGPVLGALLFTWNPRSLWLLCGILGIAAALLVMSSSRKQVTSLEPKPLS